MNTSNSDSPEEALDRLDDLLSHYFDDELDDASLTELSESLAADPEARRRYIESAQLHVDLTDYFRSGPGTKNVPIAPLNLPSTLDGPSIESL